MRKLVLLCFPLVGASLFPMFSGCSNQDIKKKVIGNDASAGDGSVGGDTCDAGGIFNYSSGQCSACPAVVDAGMGMCPPDGAVYHCNLGCGDIDLAKSSVDTTAQKITVAFTNYPLAITGVSSVYFAITAPVLPDGGFMEASEQDFPTSIDHNVLTMDLSTMPAATFASITDIAPSGMMLTDACGRPNDVGLDFFFTKSGSTFTAACAGDGGL